MSRPRNTPGWKVSWQVLLLAASILSTCFLLTRAQETIDIRVVPEVLKEKDSVTLTPEGLDLKRISNCKWYRGRVEAINIIITFFLPPFTGQASGPAYTGRETMNADCSLTITDLKLSDSGTYSFKPEGPGFTSTGATNITVSEILSSPVLWPTESLVAENSNVTLHCNTSDHLDVSIGWFKSGNPIPTMTGLSDRNRTLTLTGLTKEDEGIYTCQAANPVSKAISNPSKITVAYGPDNTTIDPQEPVYREHSSLNLSCSAISNPPASYSWYHNEKLLEAQNKSQLLISHLSLNDAGKYTCNATNDVTGLFSHTSLEISVLDSSGGLSPSGSAGAIAGTVIGSLAVILVLVGTLTYISLRVCRRNGKTSTQVVSTPQIYENVLSPGEVAPENSSTAAHTYETLQPRIQSVYEEIN